MLVSQDCTDSLAEEMTLQISQELVKETVNKYAIFMGTSIYCVPTKCQALLGTEAQERTLLLLSKIQQLLTGKQRENMGYFENGELNNGKSLNSSWGKNLILRCLTRSHWDP